MITDSTGNPLQWPIELGDMGYLDEDRAKLRCVYSGAPLPENVEAVSASAKESAEPSEWIVLDGNERVHMTRFHPVRG